MARTTFSPLALTISVPVRSDDVVRTEAGLDELLARPLTAWDRARVWLTRRAYLPPVVEGSSALGKDEALAREAGFVPLTWLVVEFWSGGRFGVECWLHSSGQLVLEVTHPVQGERVIGRGRRALATYFTDGSSLVMWHDDSYAAQLEAPSRTSLFSSGDLVEDLATFQSRVAQMCDDGKQVLSVWDVKSLARRYQAYDRFMEAPGTRRGQVTRAKQAVIRFLSLQIPLFLLLVWAVKLPWAVPAWLLLIAIRYLVVRKLHSHPKPAGAELVSSLS